MTDTVFRTKQEVTSSEEQPLIGAEPSHGSEVEVEVPYMDYGNQANHPYLVDHYAIGDRWNDPVGGFPKEVSIIESYIEGKIKDGEIGNNLTDVKNLLKGMEKTNNLSKEGRLVIKLEVLANYVEFLTKNDKLRSNLRRYSGYS